MGVHILEAITESIATTSEATLIEQAKSDKAAFGELYQRYVNRIYNYIYYRTGNVEDAEDLTARTFQRAMAHIANYEDKGVPFSAWLYRIARNLVSNWHRDQGRRQMIALDDIVHWQVGDTSPENTIQLIENEQTLLGAIQRLPGERQDLLIYKFLNRMSNAEIGAIMGRSEGAIKSLYHRTLLSLREDLGDVSVEAKKPKKSTRSRFNMRFWKKDESEDSAENNPSVDP